MVGADPKSLTRSRALPFGTSNRMRAIAVFGVLLPLSALLVQCGKAPPASDAAMSVHAWWGHRARDSGGSCRLIGAISSSVYKGLNAW